MAITKLRNSSACVSTGKETELADQACGGIGWILDLTVWYLGRRLSSDALAVEEIKILSAGNTPSCIKLIRVAINVH